MKKTILLSLMTLISVSLMSQDLATIISKHEKAIGMDAMNKVKTAKIEAVMSSMGMEMKMTMYEKQPDKIRNEIEMTGMNMQIVTVINGDKGYMINPMMGSSEPTPLDEMTLASAKNQRIIGSSIARQMKEGKVSLVGDSEYEGKAAFKIKIETEAGPAYMYIDKKDYLVRATEMEVSQMGQTYNTTIKMDDYRDVNGIKLAHKMITNAAGQNMVLSYTKVEMDIPLPDSLFEVK
jgi:outer membrane lipoprotein-sorting protein